MQKQKLFLFFLFVSLYFSCPIHVGAVSFSEIILSEIQISGESEQDDFIELYNSGNSSIDISGFQLRRKTSSGTESSVRVFEKDSTIPAKGYFLWANSDGIFSLLADTKSKSSPAKDNSIALYTKSGTSGVLIDSLAWGNGKVFSDTTPIQANPGNKISLTRDTETLLWSLSQHPNPANSKGESPVPDEEEIPQNISSGAVRINELLPNPFGDEEELEFIELYNTTLDPIDLSLWFLRDNSQGKGYLIPSGTNIPGKGYLVLFRSDFGFALNNSNESVSLFDTQGIEHDRVSYEKTKEGISLNALSGKLRGGTPTPGADNMLNTLPETKEKVPKKGFRDVPVSFDAKGDDTDKDKLKYVWNFGDNHKSYKEETSHTYDTNGTYTVTLTVNDGKDETTETFSLKITDYEAPKLRITALFPNPQGKDSESEWIRIQNKEKKEVNLKGFSIATGSSSKKMTNHPIKESFIIPGGKEKMLSRTTSLFTLPNKKGRIELRGPDKKTIDKVKYSEAKSIPEDALYEKNKQKEWEWKKSVPTEKSSSETQPDEIEQLPPNEEVLGAVAPPQEELVSPETLEREILQKEKELRYDNLRILLTSQTEFIALEKTILPEDTFSKEKILDEELSFIEKINLLLNTWLLQ